MFDESTKLSRNRMVQFVYSGALKTAGVLCAYSYESTKCNATHYLDHSSFYAFERLKKMLDNGDECHKM